jgi:cytochrome c-type biogenesis protein CcmE
MKPKYIIGIVAALVLVVTAVLSVESTKIEYMDFSSANGTGRTAQIAGTWVKEKGQEYDTKTNEFRFTMRDEKGTQMPVVLAGAKPNNFELAVSMVATGKVEDDTFHATNVLTKCPSKYESTSINTQTGK